MFRISKLKELSWWLVLAAIVAPAVLGCEPKPKKMDSVTNPGEGDPFEQRRKNQNKNDVWK